MRRGALSIARRRGCHGQLGGRLSYEKYRTIFGNRLLPVLRLRASSEIIHFDGENARTDNGMKGCVPPWRKSSTITEIFQNSDENFHRDGEKFRLGGVHVISTPNVTKARGDVRSDLRCHLNFFNDG
jgi:hypothetical protein